jgi:hypothetical protein
MKTLITTLSAAGLILVGAAQAQSPQERIAEMREWRANCNDPDPDFRLAYLEAAIATGDASVARVCISAALASDDADMRDLGLRGALGLADRLTVEFEMPEAYVQGMAGASTDDDRRQLASSYSNYLYYWGRIQGRLTLVKIAHDITDSDSTWIALDEDGRISENHILSAVVRGDRLAVTGQTDIGTAGGMTLDLAVQPDGTMRGTLALGRSGAIFNASAELL